MPTEIHVRQFSDQLLCQEYRLGRSKFGLPNAKDKVAVEAETQVDILGEIDEPDPDLDGLVERCCEWGERDLVQYSSD